MNVKRLIFAIIAVFIFVFFYEWLFHGILLHDAYAKTASLWRTEDEMKGYMGCLAFGQLVRAVAFCLIYAARPGPRSSVGGGIGYGFLVALLLIGTDLVTYAVQPLTSNLLCSWVVGGLIELVIAGAILGAIYRPASPAVATAASAPA